MTVFAEKRTAMAARFLQMGDIKTIQDDGYCGSSSKKTGGCELDKQGRKAKREVWEVEGGGQECGRDSEEAN